MSGIHIVCCLTGKHTRSRKHAKVGPDGRLRSQCTRCGQPLIRTFRRDGRVWRVDRGGAPLPRIGTNAGERRDFTHFDR